MPQAIEVGRHDEQVHQVAVIGHEVVEAAAAQPARIPQRQRETTVGRPSARLRAACRHTARSSPPRRSTTRCRRTPPPRRPRSRSRRRCGRGGARRGPGASPGGSPASRAIVATMATKPAQSRHIRPARSTPSAAAHRQRRLRQRRHRHRQLSRPAIARHGDAHLPRARRHHPEMSGEQPRVVRRSRRDVGNRRKLRAWPGERQRHDVHLAHVVARREHLDVGDAGDRVRRPDRHEASGTARPDRRGTRRGCRCARPAGD